MELYFNNLRVPKLLGYSADRKTRNTKTEYNANGDMLIDVVARKYTLTVRLGLLTAEEAKAVLAQTSEVFFDVSFYSALEGQTITRKFHLEEQPADILYAASGSPVYDECKLVLEEK